MQDYENELSQLHSSIEHLPSIFIYKMQLILNQEIDRRNGLLKPKEGVVKDGVVKQQRPKLSIVQNNVEEK